MKELRFFGKYKQDVFKPYLKKGIFPTELICFVEMCKTYNIEVILESGIGNGYSTRILPRFLQDVDFFCCDTTASQPMLQIISDQRVVCEQGNGQEKLPAWAAKFPDKSVACLIDGPKGEIAIQLATKLFKMDNVKMCAVHDQQKSSLFNFHTHDLPYTEQFKFNEEVVIDWIFKMYPKGPGLGFMIK